MSDSADDVVILDGAFEADRRRLDVGGGSLIAYTSRSPDKQTENEDTVAIIPWGPQAVVLIVADGAGGLPAGKKASPAANVEAMAAALRSLASPSERARFTVHLT